MIKNVIALYNVQLTKFTIEAQNRQRKEHKEDIFVLKITTYDL